MEEIKKFLDIDFENYLEENIIFEIIKMMIDKFQNLSIEDICNFINELLEPLKNYLKETPLENNKIFILHILCSFFDQQEHLTFEHTLEVNIMLLRQQLYFIAEIYKACYIKFKELSVKDIDKTTIKFAPIILPEAFKEATFKIGSNPDLLHYANKIANEYIDIYKQFINI